MSRVVLQAAAKVNLVLRITGRREDGYHLLDSLMQKVALYDRLVLELRATNTIRLTCPASDLPEDQGNLAYQAAALFFAELGERASNGVDIVLEKQIPVAAGLGGGSSDAAMVLRGLNLLHEDVFSFDQLMAMALRLGADVPFLLQPEPAAWARGIGEQLSRALPLRDCFMVLVTPQISVSTSWAYQNFVLTKKDGKRNFTCSLQSKISVFPRDSGVLVPMENDLESVTIDRYPEIAELKREILERGADAALMSGSGPTVFGLFSDRDAAISCQQTLRRRYVQAYLVLPLTGKEEQAVAFVD
ncbi:MAG: 4-(cytidine 5'-diphospho)-2-C-methyl-D-erythritol kinase [Desulfobulbus propionicus]|nr:MAG: 4-(cytidine 5'-diphospho)-2-C-methyl-D-erythritol kinase [Desulfobulbus propionicus]